MLAQKILAEREGALATLRFNDPDHLNAMDNIMREQFAHAMNALLDDDSVRAVLLTGEGRAFCAGANLKAMSAQQSRASTPDVGESLRTFINPVLVRMQESTKPIVAAVNGPAVGVGCGIALAADIVLMSRSAYFFQSFIRLGVVPDGGSSWVIPRLVGHGRAAAMMMLGDKIDAETAVQWGLAYKLFKDAALQGAACALARQMAQGPTLAYGRIKALLRMSLANSLSVQLEGEAANQVLSFASQDCREGIAAFVEKRVPVFTGK